MFKVITKGKNFFFFILYALAISHVNKNYWRLKNICQQHLLSGTANVHSSLVNPSSPSTQLPVTNKHWLKEKNIRKQIENIPIGLAAVFPSSAKKMYTHTYVLICI